MGLAAARRERQHRARKQLSALFAVPSQINVIHYSCESFYDNPSGGSRRITSVAVYNLGSGLSQSFSIHQIAEEMSIHPQEIAERYNDIEKSMLASLFEYFAKRPNEQWIHWNMRDTNFGFPALEHRFKVLGGTPVQIPESHLYNLAEALPEIYGDKYIEHGEFGRLFSLIQRNGINTGDFLAGRDEAQAFVNGEYAKLHLSTLRKVRAIGQIAQRSDEGRLATDANFWQRHGESLWGAVDGALDHPAAKLALAIFGIVGVILTILSRT